MNRIFLAGGSRGLGLEIARVLSKKEGSRVALLRPPSSATVQLQALGFQTRSGDACDRELMASILMDLNPHTVISTIGGTSSEGIRSDFIANRNLIDAAIQAQVQHFILITSLGTGNSRSSIPDRAYEVLKGALIEKDKAEQHLISSGLTYTIVRPGGLKSEPATGTAQRVSDPNQGGLIYRADCAQLVVSCIDNDRVYNQIFGAIDPGLMRTF